MSLAQPHHSEGVPYRDDCRSSFWRNHQSASNTTSGAASNYYTNMNQRRSQGDYRDFSRKPRDHNNYSDYIQHDALPSLKKRKVSASAWASTGVPYYQPVSYEYDPSSCNKLSLPPATTSDDNVHKSGTGKRDRSEFEDEEVVFMSRDEIERFSPSRKDGIDILHETHLRYSYCAFLQNLGVRLELPQTTIGTAMVLCHRFFVRRSHASHDRFLIATAALFLAAKSEETPCPLNNVLKASSEILHKQDFNLLHYLLPIDWFEQYRERVTEAEQLILTTLNFELNVQHPYVPLTSILEKLGLGQTYLINLALSLVSEGLRSSLWLQFKPEQIAAGAAYLAAKSLNMDHNLNHNIWQELHTPPSVLKDVVQQLLELF